MPQTASDIMPSLRPAVTCPACGKRPRLRISVAEREAHRGSCPTTVMISYQCHHCRREIYPIRAAALQEAAA
jgi:phage terminase large subunit GpA-like protein